MMRNPQRRRHSKPENNVHVVVFVQVPHVEVFESAEHNSYSGGGIETTCLLYIFYITNIILSSLAEHSFVAYVQLMKHKH